MPQDLNQAKAHKQSTSAPNRPSDGTSEHPIDDASGALAKVAAGAIRSQVDQANRLVENLAEQQELVADVISNKLSEVLNPVLLWENICAKTLEKTGFAPEGEEYSPFDLQAIDLSKRSPIAERYLNGARLPSRLRSIAAACTSESVGSLPEQPAHNV
ncbi:MAG: hypothetical protein ACKPCP_00400 [Sphaerospermopsis kisseleviana]